MRMLLPGVAVALLAGAARADQLKVPQDFETIQAAVDAAQPEDVVVIAAGSYDETIEVISRQDITLRGQGKVVLTGGQALMPTLLMDNCTGIRIERLRFEGVPGAALSVSDSGEIVVSRCRFEQPAGAAVLVAGCEGILLERLVVEQPGGAGISVQNSDFVAMTRCSVRTAGADGIEVTGGFELLIDRARVEDPTENGIQVDGTLTAVVQRCLVRNPVLTGITAGGQDAVVQDNRVLDVPESAVGLFTSAQGGVVRGNRVVGGSFAMNLGGADLQVLDNRVAKGGTIGLALGGSAGTLLVKGNRVQKTEGTGIKLDGSFDSSTLADNVAVGAFIGIHVNSDGTQLLGNRVSGASEHGFHMGGSGCLLVGNVAHGSGIFDLFDSSGGLNTYVDNDFDQQQLE